MLKLDLWKLLLDLKSIASDILRYIFEPAEWIRYIAIYFNLPSEYDTWPADKPPIYLQKSFISNSYTSSRFEDEMHVLLGCNYNLVDLCFGHLRPFVAIGSCKVIMT